MGLSEWPKSWQQSDAERSASQSSDSQILDDILNERFYGPELTVHAFWTRVCRVRGENYDMVPDSVWERICRKRGYAMSGR